LQSYESGRIGEMFGLLGDGRPTVMSRTDKQQWKKDIERLIDCDGQGRSEVSWTIYAHPNFACRTRCSDVRNELPSRG